MELGVGLRGVGLGVGLGLGLIVGLAVGLVVGLVVGLAAGLVVGFVVGFKNRQHDKEAGLLSQTTETTHKGTGNGHKTSVGKNKQRLDTDSYVLVGMLQESARTPLGPRPP